MNYSYPDKLWCLARFCRLKSIKVNQFQFQQGEVTVGRIYRHLKTDEMTGEILEDWFVVIPQIRVCRG